MGEASRWETVCLTCSLRLTSSDSTEKCRWLGMSNCARKFLALIWRAAEYWSSDNASTSGAALAFYCAFSLAPLLVILLTLVGWVVGAAAAYSQISGQLNSLFGPATAKILLDAVKSSQQAQGLTTTAISVVTLIISATTVLAALESALNQIWNSVARAHLGVRGWIRARLLSFGFVLALGFLLAVSLTFSTALSSMRAHFAAANALGGLFASIDIILSLLLVSALFALIFRYMPARQLQWKFVMAGSFLTAVLFDFGRWAIGLYLVHSTQPSAFGAATSFAALLLWLYYTAQIFLFGAEFTACLGGLRKLNGDTGSSKSRHGSNSGTVATAAASI